MADSGGRSGSVLVVDDSRVVRAVICGTLRAGGYQVDEADSGAQALRLIGAGCHDAVITDLRMPGLDGFQVLAEVKHRNPDVEVIVLTGTHAADVSCAIKALRLGAHDYLAKPPSSAEEVLLTVERAVEKKRLKDANRRLIAELQTMSRRDPLTGLFNRRSLHDALAPEIARARRHKHALAVAMFDLDHFKSINDTHGHQGGDEVLRTFARVASSGLREGDALYRYGGEEFLAVLPETDSRGAQRAAERVVGLVATTPVTYRGRTFPITVSAGVACLKHSTHDAEALIAEADDALYQAKRRGRNQAAAAGHAMMLVRRG